jgi:hypothetical protein
MTVTPGAPAFVLSDVSSPGPAFSVFAPSNYFTSESLTSEPFIPKSYVTPNLATPESEPFTPSYFKTSHTPQHQVVKCDENESLGSSMASDSTITHENMYIRKQKTSSQYMTRDENI